MLDGSFNELRLNVALLQLFPKQLEEGIFRFWTSISFKLDAVHGHFFPFEQVNLIQIENRSRRSLLLLGPPRICGLVHRAPYRSLPQIKLYTVYTRPAKAFSQARAWRRKEDIIEIKL